VAGSADAAGRARAAWGAAVLTLALAGLAACDSTQSKNERAKLGATRELASRRPQRVTSRNPEVEVTNVSLVRGRRSFAIVVDLHSSASKPLTDVPIAVGIRTRGGRRVPLNARRGLDWFQTHVPAVPAGGETTWVFAGRRRAKPGERPFALVGAPASPPISSATSLPRIEASPAGGGRVLVENGSDVPQYDLQVYALVSSGRRYLAAGKTSIGHLGTGQRKTAGVRLTGSPGERRPRVHAIPTIFD
jgi:hypothetical protein